MGSWGVGEAGKPIPPSEFPSEILEARLVREGLDQPTAGSFVDFSSGEAGQNQPRPENFFGILEARLILDSVAVRSLGEALEGLASAR